MALDDQMGSFTPQIDTSTYSTEKFYTTSRNKHDHDKVIRYGTTSKDTVRVRPELYAQFHALKETWPDYVTNADVIRDALVHLVHLRDEQSKNPSLIIRMKQERFLAFAELERVAAEKAMEEEFLQQVNEQYKTAKTGQDRDELENAIIRFLPTCLRDSTREMLEEILRKL